MLGMLPVLLLLLLLLLLLRWLRWLLNRLRVWICGGCVTRILFISILTCRCLMSDRLHMQLLLEVWLLAILAVLLVHLVLLKKLALLLMLLVRLALIFLEQSVLLGQAQEKRLLDIKTSEVFFLPRHRTHLHWVHDWMLKVLLSQ